MLTDGHRLLEEYDNLTEKMVDQGYLTEEEENIRMGVVENKLIRGINVVNKLKTKLEAFDMDREHGRLPENWEKFVDEIASIVWGNDK